MPSVFYQTTCGYGGIGRRSALRMLWRNPWGFKSPYPHQEFIRNCTFSACSEIHNFANLYTKGMKVFRPIFGVCLGVLAFCNARGVEYEDTARAASRIGATNVATTTATRPSGAIANSTTTKSLGTATRGNTASRDRATVSESRTSQKNVSSRAATNAIIPRANTTIISRPTQSNISSRNTTSNDTRGTKSRSTTTTARPRSQSRIANSARSGARTISRAATVDASGALVTNYTHCRDIYYECMDEFCANKDTNLRRCACSSRSNEFDNIKKQMSRVEDKMLDFNQRLLMVNMDAEDVTAINQSTAGEDAFYATTDKTKSKRALDEIAKKLNATFGDDDSGTSLAPISLSLNIDSAFDTVDSFMGSDTTSKSGTALYNAAIPICRETAAEVCSDEELSIAISGYQMMIEQDCNTVQKAYQAQVETARSKVFESSALLDMSRLDAYQTRNSDDILTCKRKMMEMLTNTTVCGSNMEKCLDMTGKYIDPTTGAAFLTENLADIGGLITRPDANQSWTSANGAGKFITYLKNKKQFLAPAMENCQDIADTVWDAFIEDALAQIKLAQNAKLEEIRQACTTLTSECLTAAYDSIGEFDARALSVFGVAANRTVDAMCSDVRNSCTALMGMDGDTSWETGVSAIATAKTYDSIISSCTQIGRNCIIQSCHSISGNFGLCDDIEFSANRHAILERTSCWPEVLGCVASAGDNAILNIMTSLGKNPTDNFYRDLYGNIDNIYDICREDNYCGSNADDTTCAKCRIAERIWGNCEAAPTVTIGGIGTGHNYIHMPQTKGDTLLAWFAMNTGTANTDGTSSDSRSCVNTRCTSNEYYPGYMGTNQPICVPDGATSGDITTDGLYCPTQDGVQMSISTSPSITNCCYSNPNNVWGHIPMGNNACCETANVIDGICMPSDTNAHKIALRHSNGAKFVCVGTNQITTTPNPNSHFPAGQRISCTAAGDARVVLIDDNNGYYTPSDNNTTNPNTPRMVYYQSGDSAHATPQTATGTDAWFIRYDE